MAELSPEFRDALAPLLAALGAATGRAPLRPFLGGEHAVKLEGDALRVPVRFELHWRRFRTLPTDLLREAAFQARRAQRVPGEDEADWTVFAEAFVRDEVLSHD